MIEENWISLDEATVILGSTRAAVTSAVYRGSIARHPKFKDAVSKVSVEQYAVSSRRRHHSSGSSTQLDRIESMLRQIMKELEISIDP
jgi:hypothetical protein